MLGRCEPPNHAWEWDGDGDVFCQCRATIASMETDDSGCTIRLVEPTERTLFAKTGQTPDGDSALRASVPEVT